MAVKEAENNEDSGRIISLREAADLLGVSYTTVFRMVKDGELKAFRMRNVWRTSTTVCEDYIAEQFKKQALICQSIEKR